MALSVRRKHVFSISLALFVLSGAALFEPARSQQPAVPETKPPSPTEFAPRGQRIARDIKYGAWQKFCFKPGGTKAVCRTTISGTFETGQMAVRVDLIEREGETAPRLQLFLPVGMYLQSGVTLTVDQGRSYQLPYVWCLTNACIAADVADAAFLKAMEAGPTLQLAVVDTSMISVTTEIPLKDFAITRHGAPTKTFEQAIDE